ncbi:MAG: CBS domain-containing protein [Candidatus Thermoplasmatota archaeon]|nr:CBS domain-containing protein [Candidatus Thermoplasmatota archaeon]MBU1940177.1 CBS domain-containing protein [Candidatus Thermoplasmatota archaeon]
MKKDILVKEAMKTNPLMVAPTISVFDAAKLMKKRKLGSVIVVENKQPVGILTESDILRKVVAEGLNASEILVSDVMSTPIIVTDPFISIEEAMKTMGRCNIRRLPIVEAGKLTGIITHRDITRISPMLYEICREWPGMGEGDKSSLVDQIFSGKCEDCSTLSTTLKLIDGRLLCEDCIDALKYQ